MAKKRKRFGTAFTAITFLALVSLLVYLYWSDRRKALEEETREAKQAISNLLSKDLTKDYPATPKEVITYYSEILKTLYSGIDDEDVEALALKIRELYDEELIEKNPENDYLLNLYSEIAAWNKKEQKIAFFTVSEEQETKKVNGKETARIAVTYTIQETGKLTEKWHFLLRKDPHGKWKILDWEITHD